MLLKFLALSSNLYLSFAFQSCEWLGASNGQDINCLPGWVATGTCGSAANKDCVDPAPGSRNKYVTMLQCCETKYTNSGGQNSCTQTGSKKGTLLPCLSQDGSNNPLALYGICGSGRSKDCRIQSDSGKYTFTETCCENADITVIDGGACGWRHGNYGDNIVCPAGYVASGYCGSGSSQECEAGSSSKAAVGIYCCPFEDNKRP